MGLNPKAIVLLGLLATSCGPPTPPPRPSILLITIDTLRADLTALVAA